MPKTYSVKEVYSRTYTDRFLMIQNHAWTFRSPIQECKKMTPTTVIDCRPVVLIEGSETGLVLDFLFDVLTRLLIRLVLHLCLARSETPSSSIRRILPLPIHFIYCKERGPLSPRSKMRQLIFMGPGTNSSWGNSFLLGAVCLWVFVCGYFYHSYHMASITYHCDPFLL